MIRLMKSLINHEAGDPDSFLPMDTVSVIIHHSTKGIFVLFCFLFVLFSCFYHIKFFIIFIGV